MFVSQQNLLYIAEQKILISGTFYLRDKSKWKAIGTIAIQIVSDKHRKPTVNNDLKQER